MVELSTRAGEVFFAVATNIIRISPADAGSSNVWFADGKQLLIQGECRDIAQKVASAIANRTGVIL